MDQHRAGFHVTDVLQHRQQMVEVMPVDRADIVEAEFLEQRAAADHEAAGIFLGAVGAVGDYFRQVLAQLFGRLAQRAVGLAGVEPRQIGRHGADRRGDRHVVVVEDDDQARVHGAGVVHGLIGHARRHRAVADHGDDIVGSAGEVARDCHAEAGGNRGGGVRGAERIVIALGALGETGQAAAGAQRADAVATPGQDLVRIGLVTDVPNQPVARRVEDVVDRRGQLDHAQAGAEMAARHRHRVDGFLAQLVGNLPHLVDLQLPEVVGRADGVEERRLTECGHSEIPICRSGPAARREMGYASTALWKSRHRRHFGRSLPDLKA